jgi:hypothetical protein
MITCGVIINNLKKLHLQSLGLLLMQVLGVVNKITFKCKERLQLSLERNYNSIY